jgi:hypothetical protein
MFVALKMKSFKKARAEERAVRVAFRWRKASVPNHLLPMLIYKNTFALIGTWSDHPGKQCNHKTYGCLGQLIIILSVWYALPEWG